MSLPTGPNLRHGRLRARWLSIGVVTAILGCVLIGTATATAQALTTVTDQPIALEVTNPCTGEIVAVSGVIHFVSTFVTTPSGGTVLITGQSGKRLQGISDAGTRYQITLQSRFSSSQRAAGSTFSAPTIFSFVSRSGTENFIEHGIVHGTFNARGELTADFGFFSAECTG